MYGGACDQVSEYRSSQGQASLYDQVKSHDKVCMHIGEKIVSIVRI